MSPINRQEHKMDRSNYVHVSTDTLNYEPDDTPIFAQSRTSENDEDVTVYTQRKGRHSKTLSTPYCVKRDGKKHSRRTFSDLRDCALRGRSDFVTKASFVAKRIAKYGYELLSHWELPEWLKDNKYLHHFHRPQLDTFNLCFRSIFSLHSETGNIWTHLIGLVILFFAMIFIFIRPIINPDNYPFYPQGIQEYLCFGAFFIGGCSCLTFSWLFHTLYCHSPAVNKLFAKLDYCGISFLIIGSMVPVFYYAFYCNKKLMVTYMIISLIMAILCIIASMLDIMSTPTFRSMRACIFLAFGLSSIFPIFHHFMIYPPKYSLEVTQIHLLVTMGSLYVSGCLIYMFLIPERYFPGKLNLAFQSHQIFHVCVVAAALVHLYAICKMSSYRVSKGRFCSVNETLI